MHTKKFTILHSNDMHGDFLAEAGSGSGEMIGGLALLSGYINRVRSEEENVLYVIAGDMVQGSLIDSEYRGVSTIEIMNYLSPDVATLGNHELDYGLEHLLFLERMANFPIVNANLYIKKYHKRLMMPHVILKKAGFDILFIGIITEKVMDSIIRDTEIGSFISLEEARHEVGRICNAYKNSDIDLTVLLTHIGFESDRELARMLDPAWGVDIIIGGHSHTILDQPARENDILIVQAGVGTNQIGRFDITVDDDTNSITEWTWNLVPVCEKTAPPDQKLLAFIDSFRDVVDRKYKTLLCKFATTLTHPCREEESTLGNLVADIFAETATCDVMLMGSGAIRSKELGPAVTLGDFRACFPFDETLKRYTITGSQLKGIFSHIMRPDNRDGEGECYEVNGAVRAVYNDRKKMLESLGIHGEPVDEDRYYTLGLIGYHADNCEKNLNITREDLTALGGTKVIATSTVSVLEEYLQAHPNLNRHIEGRLVFRAS
ncbi:MULTISPECIES: bifunctional UDP-sugar hydrolase/5'-nucleotidase [unclassified Methanoregula]|uniref:bifunctional metallophosphatase/5'-nucleotidase n=1 Tax=unclassified Methanoregula TaxID=2649730 RepID=UPI0009D490FF|nr:MULTISPECIES: bifunctional UDP-sugar hydrolase/5'-nucleotidase [unclassified Methanoregula]OPX61750.1 MAG: bifunctional 2',3'-cyclic nucleotide 2'-phosphodiesterase/3'-nucleotidase precursor protein [Methanoregula sp. PtaB.Bin085]OPY33941.1 MAG: bifunctional 2',3'-cyclic nucleotide 2'-phosphodiesterase/3'-nucleotidase precursor protein [Methanoregula sp. PtaU1.Bin006]